MVWVWVHRNGQICKHCREHEGFLNAENCHPELPRVWYGKRGGKLMDLPVSIIKKYSNTTQILRVDIGMV